MTICPEASSAQNSIAAVSADGSTVCVLMRRLNSSWRRSMAFVVRADFHWLEGNRVKVNSRSADSNEGGHLFQSDRGHHSNLMAASWHRLVGRFRSCHSAAVRVK